MEIKRKEVRKILGRKVAELNDIVADLDGLLTDMETDFYRVAIFGSARIKEKSDSFGQVKELAQELAQRGVDVVTGGGPGLMEAANKGSREFSKGSRSIGLPIELPFEADANSHLDVSSMHKRFSSRLDEFMRLSHAIVITPGGIGTVLELFFTWQLLQVEHIKPLPVMLLGPEGFWDGLLDWMRKGPLKEELMSAKDMDKIMLVNSVDEVLENLDPHIEGFVSNSPRMQKKRKEFGISSPYK